MSMTSDHIAEFFETVIENAPSAEEARASIEDALRAAFPPVEMMTIRVSELNGNEIIVSASGNKTAIEHMVGPSNRVRGKYLVATEHGALYLAPDAQVRVLNHITDTLA